MTNNAWPVLLADAQRALRDVVAGIAPDQWVAATPCEKWTVTQVFQHAVGDQIGYAAMLDGGPFPAEDPFSPSGHLDADAAPILDAALNRSADAWATVAVDAAQVANPLPQGPLPAWIAGGACALDAAVHAWDIAAATGQPSPLTPLMATQLLAVAREIVEPLRAYGAYGPARPADPTDAVAALLAYLGRGPESRPGD